MASRRDTKETMETKEVKETKETKETKEIVEVNGLTITEGVVYKVTHKPDSNREDSYPEEGATKFPSEGILDLFQCKYTMEIVQVCGTQGFMLSHLATHQWI